MMSAGKSWFYKENQEWQWQLAEDSHRVTFFFDQDTFLKMLLLKPDQSCKMIVRAPLIENLWVSIYYDKFSI